MFILDETEAEALVASLAKWTFIGCTSFEERFLKFAEMASTTANAPTQTILLSPRDNGSRWEVECSARQEKNAAEFRNITGWTHVDFPVDLVGGAPWAVANDILDALADDPGTVVVDITTMPKVCFAPLIHWLLEDLRVAELVVIYTEAGGYPSARIASEPTTPTILPPFDNLERQTPVAWIPIVGFVPVTLMTIYEAFVDSLDVEDRVFPVLGLPAIELSFHERAFADGARGILEALKKNVVQREHFFYAAANDPFDTRSVILRLAGELSSVSLVGSPMGSKPMTLGMVLAGRETSMTIVIAQPRSYHPDYSAGAGQLWAYPLKRAGQLAYL